MANTWENMLLVAGSGRNIGKTSLICSLIERYKDLKPIAIKISPHFHQPTEGLKTISETPDYQIFEETNLQTGKDSSRYLRHGASRSFYLQVNDNHLAEAFEKLSHFLQDDCPIFVESAALHKHVQYGIFLFVYREGDLEKSATKTNLEIADLILKTDGQAYDKPLSIIKFENGWKVLAHST